MCSKHVAFNVKKLNRFNDLTWTHQNYVSFNVKKSLRNDFLSWTHHYHVVKLNGRITQ